MAQATLRTERILLTPLADTHLPFEVELDSDPEVMRYLGDGRPRTRGEVEAQHRLRLAAAGPVPGLGFWVGLVDGRFVGWWILQPPERPDQGPASRQAELGYRLLRQYWRRGLASEGARELIRHGFEDLGLERIFAETMAVNTSSRATITPAGYNEAPFVFKRNGTYYLMWSENDTRSEDYRVAYATGASPLGPWTNRGVVLQKRLEDAIKGTGHHSVVQAPGTDTWYVAYHRFAVPAGNGTNRETTIDRMEFATDGTIRPIVPTL